MDRKELERLVREAVQKQLGIVQSAEEQVFEKDVDPVSGVIAVRSASVIAEPFDTGKASDQVFLKDVLTFAESPRLGCGVMEMTASSFDWLLKYDEVDVVLEGTLSIGIGERRLTAGKGDIVFIPKDTAISFIVPEYARFIYVTYPANWDQQE